MCFLLISCDLIGLNSMKKYLISRMVLNALYILCFLPHLNHPSRGSLTLLHNAVSICCYALVSKTLFFYIKGNVVLTFIHYASVLAHASIYTYLYLYAGYFRCFSSFSNWRLNVKLSTCWCCFTRSFMNIYIFLLSVNCLIIRSFFQVWRCQLVVVNEDWRKA